MRPIWLICAGAMLAPLDSSVNVAFPDIVASFAISPNQIQWVILPYVLTQSLASLGFGRLGDRHGHRLIFSLGLAACAVTHWAITRSSDYETLVLWRAIQGASVGMTIACAPALIVQTAPVGQTARDLSLYSAAISAGMILGPLVGGYLVHIAGWPGVYLFRVGLALVVWCALPWGLPSSPTMILPRPTETIFAGPVFRSTRFLALQATAALIYLTTFTIMLWVPFLLTPWPGIDDIVAGTVLATFPAGTFAASLWVAHGQGRWAWMKAERLMFWGLMGASAGLASTALAAGLLVTPLLLVGLGLSGIGLGCFQSAYMEQTLNCLPAQQSGVAGALVNVMRLIGLFIGVPLLSAMGQYLGIAVTLAMAAALTVMGAWAHHRWNVAVNG